MNLPVLQRLFLASTVMLSAALTPVFAAPTTYTFSTTASAFGQNTSILSQLGTLNVNGSFQYDATGDYFGNSGVLGFQPGYSIYGAPVGGVQSFSNLNGAIGANSFSDPRGSVVVANNNPFYYGTDYIQLSADTGIKANTNTYPTDYPRQLAGFTVGQYTLIDVRLFWMTGIAGVTDFLSNSQLPSTLPELTGRLALDFVRTDDPHNTANVNFYSNSVFFDGLTVHAALVPEPETYAMLLAGLGLIGAVARRRKTK